MDMALKDVVIIGKDSLAPEFRSLADGGGRWTIRWAPGVAEASDLLNDGALIVLDFELDPAAPVGLLERVQRIKGVSDIPILLVGAPSEVASMRRGVSLGADTFLVRPLDPVALRLTVEELTRQAEPQDAIDIRLLDPFIEATLHVFRTFVGSEIQVRRRFVKRNHRLFGDISGIMGLSGRATGSVGISLPSELAREIVSRILGQPPEGEITDMTRDGIGEVVNMIAGQASAAFADGPNRFHFGLPAVVTGYGHTVVHNTGKSPAPCLVATFQMLGREFALQVSLTPAAGGNG
jgi:chemotaxis protein CheX